MKNETIENLDFKAYQEIDALNHSELKNMAISAEYFRCKQGQKSFSTSAMSLGTAIHAAILEPDTFKDEFVFYRGRRAGKEYKQFQADNEGKNVIKADEMDTINHIDLSLDRNKSAAELLIGSKCELSLTWTDAHGLDCKGRIDAYKDNVLIDLKSTSCKTMREFMQSAVKYSYHTQMAYYIEGLEANGMNVDEVKIIVAQTVAPYSVFVVNVPFDTIERGFELIEEWKDELVECTKTGKWGGLADEEHRLDLPEWAKGDDDTSLVIDDMEVTV